jgi:hypothetical protein
MIIYQKRILLFFSSYNIILISYILITLMYVCCQLLASVQVEKLLVAAVADRVETWTRSFSFKPVEPQLREEVKRLSLVVITGTTLLQKSIAEPPHKEQRLRRTPLRNSEYTIAPMMNNKQMAVVRLSDDELAFLEMEPFCSFTDLVVGNVSLQRSCATNSSASMSPGSSRSSGEAGAMMIHPNYAQSQDYSSTMA